MQLVQSDLRSGHACCPWLQRKSTAADLKLQRVAQENEAARQARAAEAQLRHEYTHKRMEIKVAVLCCLRPEATGGSLACLHAVLAPCSTFRG